MKKKFTYIILLALFFGTSAFVVLRYHHSLKNKLNAFYPMLDRKGTLAKSAEWQSIKSNAENLIRIVRDNPQDKKSALALATLYVQEGRASGNFNYYDKAALHYIDALLEMEANDFQALSLKSLVQLSQHHFADGLATAEKAKSINPYNAFVYGLLVDGNVEMGNYKEAVKNSDKMVSIRPDIRSYSRISYLREIHGDYPGAIEAMQMAVDAGVYGDEPTSWARIQLARLFENTGDIKAAEMHYTIALNERPGYPYAIAGLGRIALWKKDYAKAISLFAQADELMPDGYFKEQLAKAYLLSGDEKKANEFLNKVADEINHSVQASAQDENTAHHADAELAHIYLLLKDYDKALTHAANEYNRRPNNIDVNALMAWTYYKLDETNKALPYLDAALRTNCKNPTFLCQAGLIYFKSGNKQKAKVLWQEAFQKDPNIDVSLKEECKKYLQTIL
jgi:tetratricopeptide (TPR) repeat protein